MIGYVLIAYVCHKEHFLLKFTERVQVDQFSKCSADCRVQHICFIAHFFFQSNSSSFILTAFI